MIELLVAMVIAPINFMHASIHMCSKWITKLPGLRENNLAAG
jgi:hypothetical protein